DEKLFKQEQEWKSSKWKTILLKSIGIGAGVGVGVGLVFGLIYYVATRPKSWNKDAIKAISKNAQIVDAYTPVDPSGSSKFDKTAMVVQLTFENRTAEDYNFEDGTQIMLVNRSTGALEDSAFQTHKLFVPAHHTVGSNWVFDVFCAHDPEKGTDKDCYKKWIG